MTTSATNCVPSLEKHSLVIAAFGILSDTNKRPECCPLMANTIIFFLVTMARNSSDNATEEKDEVANSSITGHWGSISPSPAQNTYNCLLSQTPLMMSVLSRVSKTQNLDSVKSATLLVVADMAVNLISLGRGIDSSS